MNQCGAIESRGKIVRVLAAIAVALALTAATPPASAQTRSEIVRESRRLAGVRVSRHDPAKMAELRQRAAALRATQSEPTDVVALLHEARGDSLRLRLRRLTVPFTAADLAC